jgi:hypothetical protein
MADPARLIFLDEADAKTNLTRLRGRRPRAEHVHTRSAQGLLDVGVVASPKDANYSMILRCVGVVSRLFITPFNIAK